jgi:hypothetical protein
MQKLPGTVTYIIPETIVTKDVDDLTDLRESLCKDFELRSCESRNGFMVMDFFKQYEDRWEGYVIKYAL